MSTIKSIIIPDIGNAKNVDVIDIAMQVGKTVNKDDTLITLESDKATMDIPAPFAGVIKEIKIKKGAKVSEGDEIATIEVAGEEKKSESKKPVPEKTVATAEPEKTIQTITSPTTTKPATAELPSTSGFVHAGPSVRRFARELGVDLTKVTGSGEKGRVVKTDVQAYVKHTLTNQASASFGLAVGAQPAIDFSQFGEITKKPLSKIKRLTGANVHRSWVTIPHVTQFDEADITELENFRQENKHSVEKQGAKLTLLTFLMKAVVTILHEMPLFNSSLDNTGENLIMKNYFHIGIAVDTPDGLVVPVIRDVNTKGIVELAVELAQVSEKARQKKLLPKDMQGSCFTISSLGGVGSINFTPIINAPDVAILGVAKAQMKPVYQHDQFVPRLLLPLALSYDHRVIDGADAARFTTRLASLLADIRGLLL